MVIEPVELGAVAVKLKVGPLAARVLPAIALVIVTVQVKVPAELVHVPLPKELVKLNELAAVTPAGRISLIVAVAPADDAVVLLLPIPNV